MEQKENIIPLQKFEQLEIKDTEQFVKAIQRKTYQHIKQLNDAMNDEEANTELNEFLLKIFNLEELTMWDQSEWKKNKDGLVLQAQPLEFFFQRFSRLVKSYALEFDRVKEDELVEYVSKVRKKLTKLSLTEELGFK